MQKETSYFPGTFLRRYRKNLRIACFGKGWEARKRENAAGVVKRALLVGETGG